MAHLFVEGVGAQLVGDESRGRVEGAHDGQVAVVGHRVERRQTRFIGADVHQRDHLLRVFRPAMTKIRGQQ